MGTPDYISSVETVEKELVRLGLVCRDGHPLTDLQTKDLAEAMQSYVLGHDVEDPSAVRLYGPARKNLSVTHGLVVDDCGDYETTIPFGVEAEGAPRRKYGLAENNRSFYPCRNHTGSIVCSATCSKCIPIFFESTSRWDNGLGRRETFFEAELWLEKGLLSRVVVVGPSRDEQRAQMLKDGVGVLPDDDRLVKREIQEWLKKTGADE